MVTQGQDCKWTVGFPELRAISDRDKALAVEEQGFQLKRGRGRRNKGEAIRNRGCSRSVHKQALAFFFPMEVNSVSLHTDEVTQEKEEINHASEGG